jgi:hypothetical protein
MWARAEPERVGSATFEDEGSGVMTAYLHGHDRRRPSGSVERPASAV